MKPSTLIDDIYEAAVVPGLWVRTLDRMAEIAAGEGGVLIAESRHVSQIVNSPSLQPLVDKWQSGGWSENKERRKRFLPVLEPRFLTDLDVFAPEELSRLPYYQEFLRPAGFGWCAATAIHAPAGDTILFAIERLFDKGPVEPAAISRLDELRPHLARAAVLSAKIGIERARSTVFAMESIDIPAAVLTETAKVVAANSLLQRCAPSMTIGARDLLSFQNPASQTFFQMSLGSVDAQAAARSFPLFASGDNAPAVAHLVPLRGAGRDLFTGAAVLLYVTTVSRHSALPAALLQALFDLKPAEARVARLIGSGSTVGEAAQLLDVKGDTIRAQLKSIFAKTGARRQAELVTIVASQLQPNSELSPTLATD